jgi:hypothetical protein
LSSWLFIIIIIIVVVCIIYYYLVILFFSFIIIMIYYVPSPLPQKTTFIEIYKQNITLWHCQILPMPLTPVHRINVFELTSIIFLMHRIAILELEGTLRWLTNSMTKMHFRYLILQWTTPNSYLRFSSMYHVRVGSFYYPWSWTISIAYAVLKIFYNGSYY